jgi:hypothetical protein
MGWAGRRGEEELGTRGDVDADAEENGMTGFNEPFPIEADVLEEAGEAGRVVVGVVSVADEDGTERDSLCGTGSALWSDGGAGKSSFWSWLGKREGEERGGGEVGGDGMLRAWSRILDGGFVRGEKIIPGAFAGSWGRLDQMTQPPTVEDSAADSESSTMTVSVSGFSFGCCSSAATMPTSLGTPFSNIGCSVVGCVSVWPAICVS